MVLLAFLLALVVSLAALVFAVVRGVGLYRQAKRTGRAVSGPLAAFEAKAAEADRHLDAFDRSSKDLELALARLRRSRAELQVLRNSIERARTRIHWLRILLPAR